MWQRNDYRENDHLDKWQGKVYTNEHFYHVGAKENNRNSIIEAFVIR